MFFVSVYQVIEDLRLGGDALLLQIVIKAFSVRIIRFRNFEREIGVAPACIKKSFFHAIERDQVNACVARIPLILLISIKDSNHFVGGGQELLGLIAFDETGYLGCSAYEDDFVAKNSCGAVSFDEVMNEGNQHLVLSQNVSVTPHKTEQPRHCVAVGGRANGHLAILLFHVEELVNF